MSPYREASTRVDVEGERWGATLWTKLYVRLFARLLCEQRRRAREMRAFYRRVAAYEVEIAMWREQHATVTGCSACKRWSRGPWRRCPMPIRPAYPPRYVLE